MKRHKSFDQRLLERDLFDPKYRKKVIRNRKKYYHKKRERRRNFEDEE